MFNINLFMFNIFSITLDRSALNDKTMKKGKTVTSDITSRTFSLHKSIQSINNSLYQTETKWLIALINNAILNNTLYLTMSYDRNYYATITMQ